MLKDVWITVICNLCLVIDALVKQRLRQSPSMKRQFVASLVKLFTSLKPLETQSFWEY